MKGQDLFNTAAEWSILTKEQKNKAKMLTTGRSFNPDLIDELRRQYDKWAKDNPVHMTRQETRNRRNQRMFNPIGLSSTNTRDWQNSIRLTDVPNRASQLSQTPFNPIMPPRPRVTYAPTLGDIADTAVARAPTEPDERPPCNKRSGCSMMGGRYKRSIKRSIRRNIKRRKMSRKRRHR